MTLSRVLFSAAVSPDIADGHALGDVEADSPERTRPIPSSPTPTTVCGSWVVTSSRGSTSPKTRMAHASELVAQIGELHV